MNGDLLERMKLKVANGVERQQLAVPVDLPDLQMLVADAARLEVMLDYVATWAAILGLDASAKPKDVQREICRLVVNPSLVDK